MTTIAFRNGILAADTRSTSGETVTGSVVKIAKAADGSLAAAVGNSAYCYRYREWVTAGRIGDAPLPVEKDGGDDAKGVLIDPAGKVWQFESRGICPIEAEYLAWGSGRDFALGAMFSGADAEAAVKAAAAHDPYTGGEITVLRR